MKTNMQDKIKRAFYSTAHYYEDTNAYCELPKGVEFNNYTLEETYIFDDLNEAYEFISELKGYQGSIVGANGFVTFDGVF